MCMFINRDCDSGGFFLPVGEVRRCVNQCSPQTTCGPIIVPEDHLKVAEVYFITIIVLHLYEYFAKLSSDQGLMEN